MKRCSNCNRHDLGEGVAAHNCPHGNACRHATRGDGSVLDWLTLECALCTLRCAAERVLSEVAKAPDRVSV